MPKHNLQVKDRVWWTDPDDGLCSQAGTITRIQHDEDDAVIAIDTDAGGNLEALPGELTKLSPRIDWLLRMADRHGGMAEVAMEGGDAGLRLLHMLAIWHSDEATTPEEALVRYGPPFLEKLDEYKLTVTDADD